MRRTFLASPTKLGAAVFAVFASACLTSGMTEPTWRTESVHMPHAIAGQPWSGKLSGWILPFEGAVFSRLSGPEWLQISSEGELSGTPPVGISGRQTFRFGAASPESHGKPVAVPMELEVFPPDQEDITRIQVMTFNVWKGWSQVSDGLEKGISSILLSGADVVGLQESSPDQARQVAERLGWHHASAGTGSSQIISRYPIEDTFPATCAVGARIRLTTSPARSITLVNCHLDYQYYGPYAARDNPGKPASVLAEENRSKRAAQTRSLLDEIGPLSGDIPLFLTGDFNAPSHLDWTAANVSRHFGSGHVPWPTSTAVIAAGFTDSFRAAHPDPLSVPGNTWSSIHRGSEPQDRIDFIYFRGKGVRVISSKTFVTRVETTVKEWGTPVESVTANTWPSDHAAVLTVFSIGDR